MSNIAIVFCLQQIMTNTRHRIWYWGHEKLCGEVGDKMMSPANIYIYMVINWLVEISVLYW